MKCRRNVRQGVPPVQTEFTRRARRDKAYFSGESDEKDIEIDVSEQRDKAATNDKHVHSSRSEYEAVGECGKRTKMTHATIEFRLACRPCGRFETLYRC